MFNIRTLAVIKRELREKLFSKSFLLMTFLIPLLMFGILGVQTLLMTFEDDKGTYVEIISESDSLNAGLQLEVADAEVVKSGYYQVAFQKMSRKELNKYLTDKKKEIISGRLTGIIFVPGEATLNKKMEYYSKSPFNNTLFNKLKDPINRTLVKMYFKDKSLTSKDLEYVGINPDFKGLKITESAASPEEGGIGNMILSFFFTFLLYFSLIFIGQLMMRSVVEEKNNRIVEVLLSSVNSQELMTGKILGTAITGLFQMFIWMSPALVLISTSWFMLPPEIVLKLSGLQIAYFFLNYIMGLTTFLGLFACVGAIFDNDQDAQSGLWPVMMLIMIPFFIAITVQNNPDNIIMKVSSMLPFASIIVMPARMTMLDVPFYQLLVALAINFLTLFFCFTLSGKIYRVGILMTGKKPKWSEVVRWLKNKY